MPHSVARSLVWRYGPCVVANVGVADIMLCNMALASLPLAVGIVARSLTEEWLLLESVGVLARGRSPRHWMQCSNIKQKKKQFWEHICYKTWMSSNTAVRSFYKLGPRVLGRVALHRAYYFSLDMRVYEETVIDMIVCAVSHDVLIPCNSICTVL